MNSRFILYFCNTILFIANKTSNNMNTKHSRQKALSLVAFLMLLVATTAQAKRVVERPYFLGSNNHKLEI